MRCATCGEREAEAMAASPDGRLAPTCLRCLARGEARRVAGSLRAAVRSRKPRKAASSDGMMTAAEVAVKLRLSKSTVLRLARRGELRHVRVGRAVRFPAAAVETFLRRHRRGL